MSSKFTKTSDALLSQLVGHCKNTRAKGPAHVFSQRLIEMSWYAWYHSDLSGGEQPSEPRGTYRRECVTRPGMLYCLFLQDVAHPLISDTFPHVSGTGSADGKTVAKGPLHDHIRGFFGIRAIIPKRDRYASQGFE
jgi:hypothetical protein